MSFEDEHGFATKGHSHFNSFAEKYKQKNKKHFTEYYEKKVGSRNKALESKKK